MGFVRGTLCFTRNGGDCFTRSGETLASDRMKTKLFVAERPFADPDVAARKLLEIANDVEVVQDGCMSVRMFSSVRVFEWFGFLCACVLIVWLNFIEPISTYLALDEIEGLPTVALACGLSAGLLSAACAILVIWDIKRSAANGSPSY